MRRVNRCLNSKLIDLCQQALKLEDYTAKVQEYLPVDLREHCIVSSFAKGCLVLLVSDSVWASQIRYAVPELRDTLRREGKMYQLSSIKIILGNLQDSGTTRQIRHLQLSEQAREAIIAGAEQCEYAPLKQAWYHLAYQPAEDYASTGNASSASTAKVGLKSSASK